VGRRRLALLAAALIVPRHPAAAQVGATPAYRVSQLECSQFIETSHTTIITQTGRRAREQSAGRMAWDD
jgi:hypothetical protein